MFDLKWVLFSSDIVLCIYDLELQFTLKLTYQIRIIRRKIASKINLPIFTDGEVCSWVRVTCQILNWKYFLCFLVENLRIGKYNDTKIKLLLTIFENWMRLNNKFSMSENNNVQIKSQYFFNYLGTTYKSWDDGWSDIAWNNVKEFYFSIGHHQDWCIILKGKHIYKFKILRIFYDINSK